MITKELVKKALEHFRTFKNEKYVVEQSFPILYFGDLKEYSKSKLKVITVGKNPSDNEFPSDNRLFRFPKWNAKKENLLEVLNLYFETEPYKKWFSAYEHILNGVDTSYYTNNEKGYKNIALHTDICSPLATDPVWSKLEETEQKALKKEGAEIWKELMEELQPDIIFISLNKKIFKEVLGENTETIIYTKKGDTGKTPSVATQSIYKLKSGKEVKVIFGRYNRVPFGNMTNDDKENVGRNIK